MDTQAREDKQLTLVFDVTVNTLLGYSTKSIRNGKFCRVLSIRKYLAAINKNKQQNYTIIHTARKDLQYIQTLATWVRSSVLVLNINAFVPSSHFPDDVSAFRVPRSLSAWKVRAARSTDSPTFQSIHQMFQTLLFCTFVRRKK